MEKSWIVAVFILGAFVSVQSLQCYECTNCPSDLEDSLLKTCSATTITDVPSITKFGLSTNHATPDIDISTTPNPGASRVRREVTEIGEEKKCTCFGAACACDDEENNPSRSFQYAVANDTAYVCAKGIYTLQNGTEITSRGCVPSTVNDKEFCAFGQDLAAAANVTLKYCSTCSSDRCNGAFSFENSTIAMVLFLTMLFIAK